MTLDKPLLYDGKWLPFNPTNGFFYFKPNSSEVYIEARLHELDYHQDKHESHSISIE